MPWDRCLHLFLKSAISTSFLVPEPTPGHLSQVGMQMRFSISLTQKRNALKRKETAYPEGSALHFGTSFREAS